MQSVWNSFVQFLTATAHVGKTALPFSLLDVLLKFVLPIVAYQILRRLLSRSTLRFVARLSVSRRARHRILRWIRIVVRSLFALLAVILAAAILGAGMKEFLTALLKLLNQPIYSSGNTRVSLLTLVLSIPVIYASSWLSKIVRIRIDHNLLSRISMDHARRFTASNLLRYAFMVIFLLIGLSIIGIDFSSLIVIFGVLGIGIGFGLQNIIANFVSGLVIFVSRPIKVGDRILVNEHEGDVVQIRLIACVINTLTNETLIIPNSQIVNNAVHNYSYEDRRIIIVNEVQVAYGSDLDQVETVLSGVGARNPYGNAELPSTVLIRTFDSSGITVELRTWIKAAQDKLKARSWANLEIWRAFKDNGIQIPFPQIDLHVKDEPIRPVEEK
ncbi:MAG TPA: mechanosensitive ion channel domain-containing protein [Spirochaetia bacterium]|nr:mechanosensitive ion channel domain-containing protein [Spirochaetia bacterium]